MVQIPNKYGNYEDMVEISTPSATTAKAVLVQGAWYPASVLVSKYVGCGVTKTYVPAAWYAKKAGDRAKYYGLRILADIEKRMAKIADEARADEFSTYSHARHVRVQIEELWNDTLAYLETRVVS